MPARRTTLTGATGLTMLHPLRIEPTFAAAAAAPEASAPTPPPTRNDACADLPSSQAQRASIAAWAGVACTALLLGAPCLWPASAASTLPDVVTTGSLAHTTAPEAPAAAQPAAAMPATGEPLQPLSAETFTVSFGESPAPATLWGRWRFLQQTYADEIGALAAAVRPSPNAPQRQVLTLGPFPNAARAAEFCGRWRAKGVGCEVARADGSRLSPGA
jgi:hypothetical protein